MKAHSLDRTGILIVRVWNEDNSPEGFRARITHTLDSTLPEHVMTTAGSPHGVYAAVRTWMEAFVQLNRVTVA